MSHYKKFVSGMFRFSIFIWIISSTLIVLTIHIWQLKPHLTTTISTIAIQKQHLVPHIDYTLLILHTLCSARNIWFSEAPLFHFRSYLTNFYSYFKIVCKPSLLESFPWLPATIHGLSPHHQHGWGGAPTFYSYNNFTSVFHFSKHVE